MWMNLLMIVVVVLAAGVFLMVTGRRQHERQRTRLDVNRELYEQRIQELDQEIAEGLLSEDAARRSRRELDKRFVHENAELEQLHDERIRSGLWLPAAVVMVLGVGGYMAFGSWGLQQQADEALQALPELGRKVITDDSAQTTPEELETFALGLRQKLLRAPDDAVAWLVYGRVMLALGQLEQAIDAFEKSYQLDPDRTSTQLSYAQLLVSTGDEQYLGKAARLLSQVLSADPQNPDALSLLGVVAYQRGDYQQAVTAWQLLLQQLPETDARYQAIDSALTDAQDRLAGAQLKLEVLVDVHPSVAAMVPPDGTLFVYVRDPDGVPMPAAVVRQPVDEFPVLVTLSDADAMLDDYRLSTLQQWQVMARISADEQIDQAPGDLDAGPVTVEPGTAQVKLVIRDLKLEL
ncbi:c-type cytochrome biogenesis protein CcmI [Pseudidiomarina sp.]|uniref:c-type cytochrome biogenesis protein CcmI n=1 Tax=Pseudidiomarina sp. TaxID=2081707 RepID=UPI00299ED93E|nr:c-type cytochrome biogenesis protein CcmI [Pseudidiomarina sp.]MDX1706659.1 c-type cytochrome biogenesis protein CcmI [Pseudidiomarina sp.]